MLPTALFKANGNVQQKIPGLHRVWSVLSQSPNTWNVICSLKYYTWSSYIQMMKCRRQKTFLAYVTGKLCKMHSIFSRRAAASSRYHQHTLHDLSLNPWESPSKLLSCWAEQLEHLTAPLCNLIKIWCRQLDWNPANTAIKSCIKLLWQSERKIEFIVYTFILLSSA